MAPNRHRIRQVPLELKALAFSKQQLNDVVYTPTSKQQPSDAAYWDWPAEDDISQTDYEEEEIVIDIFSANHIVSNLIRESSRLQETKEEKETANVIPADVIINSVNPANYDYWAEASYDAEVDTNIDDLKPAAVPQHHPVSEVQGALVSKDEYWSERSNGKLNSYWNERNEPLYHPQKNDILTVIREDEDVVSKTYWDEKDDSKVAASDRYWKDSADSHGQKCIVSGTEYWEWQVEEKNAIDNYWYW